MTRKLITASRKKKHSRKWLLIVLIVLLCFMPFMLIKYINKDNAQFDTGTENRGHALSPPVAISQIKLINADGMPLSALHIKRKWGLVYITPKTCEESCINNINKMYQIKTFILHKYVAFYLMVITPPAEIDTNPVYAMIRRHYPTIQYVTATKVQLNKLFKQLPAGTQNQNIEVLYAIDPNGYLVISYPPTEAGSAVLKNLKQIIDF